MSTSEKLATFEQAEDLLVQMKAKGIDQINLCYQGALTGGFNQKQATDAKLLISLGGKMRFNDLYESMSIQKLQLFLAADRFPPICAIPFLRVTPLMGLRAMRLRLPGRIRLPPM